MASADPSTCDGAGPAPVLVPEAAVAVDHHFYADSLYTLRATLAAHADHLGAAADAVEKLLIAGSEPATNAVRHGGGTGRLKKRGDGPYLRCQASDQGLPCLTPLPSWVLHAPPQAYAVATTVPERFAWTCGTTGAVRGRART